MKVFISYRRDDSHYIADRIYDWLIRARGRRNVFKDVDSIPLGRDFRRVIHDAVGRCDVLLVVIGPGWLTAAKAPGMRRLDDPDDFVRMEIEAAIERDIPVIPLLVNNATMPTAEDLPPSLRSLVYRNGLLVRPDPDFHNDMGRLIAALSKTRFLLPGRRVITPILVSAVVAALVLLLAISATNFRRIRQPPDAESTPVATPSTTALIARDPGAEAGGDVKATSADPERALREEKKFHGVTWGLSYEQAIELARAQGKPVLIDFTGVNSANCRQMEREVMPRPEIRDLLRQFVTVALYTDYVPIVSLTAEQREELAHANQRLQYDLSRDVTTPFYVILTPEGRLVDAKGGYIPAAEYRQFLQAALSRSGVGPKVARAG